MKFLLVGLIGLMTFSAKAITTTPPVSLKNSRLCLRTGALASSDACEVIVFSEDFDRKDSPSYFSGSDAINSTEYNVDPNNNRSTQGPSSINLTVAAAPSYISAPTCSNSLPYSGDGLLIDSKDPGSNHTCPGDIAWKRVLGGPTQYLASGIYELRFWTKGNTTYSDNEIIVYLRNKNNPGARVTASLTNASGGAISPSAVDNTALCGTLMYYRFTVNASDQCNEFCLQPYFDTNHGAEYYGNSHDFVIDNVQLVRLAEQPAATFAINGSATSPYVPSYPINFQTTTQFSPGCTFIWNWDDGTPATTGSTGGSSTTYITGTHAFAQGRARQYQVTLTVRRTYTVYVGGGMATVCEGRYTLPVAIYRPLCGSNIPATNNPLDGFQFDSQTGSIEFKARSIPCDIPPSGLECISGQGSTVAQVVAVSMTAFTDSLVQEDASYRPGSIDGNPFLQGQGQLRPYATYTYQAPLTSKTPSADYSYEFGSFQSGLFNPRASARARPSAWLAAAVAERVSPNGEMLQERDPLGVHSAAKYGYGHILNSSAQAVASVHALPYLQAHNAESSTVLFESFENRYTNTSGETGEDGLILLTTEVAAATSSAKAHTGAQAAKLLLQAGSNKYQLTLKPVPLNSQLQNEGLLVKCWLFMPSFNWASSNPTIGQLLVAPVDNSTSGSSDLKVVAQVGNWCLAECRMALTGLSGVAANTLLVPRLQITSLSPAGSTSELWIDDVRLQPGASQLTAYVYDPRTLRLLASFDDQHYALRYQYNNQGQLIRKQAETERGIKTLQETFYHAPQQPAP